MVAENAIVEFECKVHFTYTFKGDLIKAWK